MILTRVCVCSTIGPQLDEKWNGKFLLPKYIDKNYAQHTSLFTKKVHLTCRVHELFRRCNRGWFLHRVQVAVAKGR